MNHGWLRPVRRSISAVPVLPATSMPCSAAAVPVPSLTTLRIIVADLRGGLGSTSRARPPRAAICVDRAPVGVDDLGRRCAASSARRRWRPPPRPRHLQRRDARACPGRSPTRPTSTRARRRRGAARPVVALAAGRASARRGSRSAGLRRSRSAACTRASSPCRASRRPAAQTVLTEFVSAVGQVDVAEVLVADVVRAARRRSPSPFLPLDHRVRRELAGVDRRDRGDDLERRARRVAGLRRAVEQRRVRVAC